MRPPCSDCTALPSSAPSICVSTICARALVSTLSCGLKSCVWARGWRRPGWSFWALTASCCRPAPAPISFHSDPLSQQKRPPEGGLVWLEKSLFLGGRGIRDVGSNHLPLAVLNLRQARHVAAQTLGGREGGRRAAKDVSGKRQRVHHLDEAVGAQ